jgi:uncharacterized repeat protein (TIGR03943 family)
MLWLLISGDYQRFMRASLWPLQAGAVILLVPFSLALLHRAAQSGISGRASARRWLAAVIMVVPLVFMLGVPESGLGGYALSKRSLQQHGVPAQGHELVQRLEAENLSATPQELTLQDLVANRAELAGEAVATIGRVFHPPERTEGYFTLYRFALTCCAADAQPLEMLVHFADARSLANDSWVRVEGVLIRLESEPELKYLLTANRVDKIEPPENSYLENSAY